MEENTHGLKEIKRGYVLGNKNVTRKEKELRGKIIKTTYKNIKNKKKYTVYTIPLTMNIWENRVDELIELLKLQNGSLDMNTVRKFIRQSEGLCGEVVLEVHKPKQHIKIKLTTLRRVFTKHDIKFIKSFIKKIRKV